jgi:predicted phage baseplate assembly protein
MGLPVPRLDDKTFNEIVDEVRSLIPRYYPEWTDHNVHDPGITFIELFAWLAEMQIYQLDQITDQNYKKFLKLLNYYPCDIQPARVDITFENKDNKDNIHAEIPVPVGTQIFTGVEPEQLVFEVMEDFNLIPGQIKSIITTYDSKTVDNTEANETENGFFCCFW